MSEDPFTTRELRTMFSTIEAKLEMLIKKVGWLERMVWLAVGGVMVLTFFMGLDRLDFNNKINGNNPSTFTQLESDQRD